MKISEIEEVLKQTPIEALEEQLSVLKTDTRQGVIKLCNRYQKKLLTHQKEQEAFELKLQFDALFKGEQYQVIGVDEVGRGPLAGPVVAAAVVLSSHCDLVGIKDSKKLSEARREELYKVINQQAIAIGIGIVDAEEIDAINILQATFKAMREALLKVEGDIVLVDGDKTIPGCEKTQHAVIKGDDKSAAIAAASIIAKVTRDRMMLEYARTYPEYDWESNKGYGSAKHYQAIKAYGLTPLHRRSFLKNI